MAMEKLLRNTYPVLKKEYKSFENWFNRPGWK